jgi:hypothetical protein
MATARLPKAPSYPERVLGLRLGTRVYTPFGIIDNGQVLSASQRRHLIEVQGYTLERCDGIRAADLSPEELEDIAAADKVLGINTLASGLTQLQTQIDKGMKQILAPLTKKFYRDSIL